MKKILKVRNLTKCYGSRTVLSNISFSVHAGEIFGFLGANGAGKSTTMKIITGLAEATSGSVTINGKNVRTHFVQAISNVGSMIENPQFFPYLTGYQNLKYYAKMYPNCTKSKILEIAELVGLKNRIYDKTKTYSLGMKQRLGIAQALLNEPKLLVLDEPTNGLDANGIREIKNFLIKIAKKTGVAIMISSHILAIMESLCDTICIIDNGQITDMRSIEEIKKSCAKYGSHYIKTSKPNYAGFLIQEKLQTKVGVTKNKVLFNADSNKLAEAIVFLTKNKVPIYAAGEVDYSLEDAYLDIVGNDASVE